MTVAKLLTGEDRPLGNMEMTLTNTYHLAQARFRQQQEKANRSSGKTRH